MMIHDYNSGKTHVVDPKSDKTTKRTNYIYTASCLTMFTRKAATAHVADLKPIKSDREYVQPIASDLLNSSHLQLTLSLYQICPLWYPCNLLGAGGEAGNEMKAAGGARGKPIPNAHPPTHTQGHTRHPSPPHCQTKNEDLRNRCNVNVV